MFYLPCAQVLPEHLRNNYVGSNIRMHYTTTVSKYIERLIRLLRDTARQNQNARERERERERELREREGEREILKFGILLWHLNKHGVLLTA